MAGDVAPFGNYFPQAADSLDQTLKRILARMVRPAEEIVTYLALAARLGSTVGALIDTRGARGILINNRVTAVAGAGTIQMDIATKTDALMSTAATRILLTPAVTVSQGAEIHPGVVVIGSSAYSIGCSMLGRFTQITLINASAVPGNEVTSEVSYILLY